MISLTKSSPTFDYQSNFGIPKVDLVALLDPVDKELVEFVYLYIWILKIRNLEHSKRVFVIFLQVEF